MSSNITLGVRNSPNEVRYVLLENHGDGTTCFMNHAGENRLQYPASLTETKDRLKWLKDELDRIFRQTPGIRQVVIKTNEFTGSETKPKRESAYADAICILVAAEHSVPVSCKLYTQMGSTSGEAKNHAENRVGRTAKHWDTRIADAALAAYSVR